MNTRDEIKILIFKSGTTLKKVAQKMTELGRPITPDGLSNKLRRGSLRHDEYKLIIDILGYKIKLVEKKDEHAEG